MKKLLMTLTSVLSAGVIYADAQFYEMELTVKTTKTRSGKVSGIACDCRTDLEAIRLKIEKVTQSGAVEAVPVVRNAAGENDIGI